MPLNRNADVDEGDLECIMGISKPGQACDEFYILMHVK